MLSKQAKIKPVPVPDGGASPGAAPEGKAGQEAAKKGKASPEALKKGKESPEAPKKEEASPEAPTKGEPRQDAPKKEEAPPEAPKKEEARQQAPKKGEASQETPQEGESCQEAPKKPVLPFGKVPFRPHHWRLVTFILGACSLILLIGLLGLIGNYLQISEATRRKMVTLQKENEKIKDSVRKQAGGKGSRCDPCLDDWVQRGDACYLFSSLQAKWPECVQHCQTKGAKLVKMESQGELVFLKRQTLKFYLSQFRYRRYYSYWIGLTYKTTLKKWVWLDESPFTLALHSLGFGIVDNVNDICVFFSHGKSHVKDCSLKHRCLCKKNK